MPKIVPPNNSRPKSASQWGPSPNLDAPKRENFRLRQQSAMLRTECKRVFRQRPSPAMVKALLAEAERGVRACDEAVERQRSIIKEAERDGHNDDDARTILHDLLNTQALHVLTRDRLLELLTE